MISLSWGAASDKGRIRKDNQDSFIADGTVFAVADGMGGHAGGEIASRLAIGVLSAEFSGESQVDSDIVSVVRRANSVILSHATKEPKLAGMGTTLCLVSVAQSEGKHVLNLINVGDSRGYLYRNGELYQLTDDHTLVSEMLRSGDITKDQVGSHRARHILTRALGVDPEVEIDHWEIEPKEKDLYLLCSDGLTNEMTDPEIAQCLGKYESAEQTAHELVAGALASGGSDNVTCVVVQVEKVTMPSSSSQAGDRSRIVELPSQTKLRERLQAASHSVGADMVERERFLSVVEMQKQRDEDAKQRAAEARANTSRSGEAESSESAGKYSSPAMRVNPVITSSTTRSQGFSTIPAPLPKRATERKVRFGTLFRSLVFLAILAVVLVIGVSAVGIYAKHSYFVGIDNSNVAIFRGRPGGLLWYNPTLIKETKLKENQVAPYHVPDLQKGVVEPSLSAANSYVDRLISESNQISSTSSGSTGATSSSGSSTVLAGGGG